MFVNAIQPHKTSDPIALENIKQKWTTKTALTSSGILSTHTSSWNGSTSSI